MAVAQPTPRILVVHDDPELRGLILRELRPEFEGVGLLEIADEAALERAIAEDHIEIVIIDHQMSWNDGLTVLRTIKLRKPSSPVIMFSDSRSQELVIEAMKAKLDDFVVRSPESYKVLRSAVRAAFDKAARTVEDETLQTQIEEAVRSERNTFQALLDSQPGIVYMFDDNGRFLRWNKQLEGVSGYSTTEIAQMLPVEFIAEEHRGMVTERIMEVFQKGVSQADAHFLTKDCQKIPYSFTGRRVEFNGRMCLIGVGIDISGRKRAEDELRRTAEALRQADQRKNNFLAILAHELRNPLGPIRNAVQILRKSRPLDGEGERLRGIVDRQVKHMARLIDDLLDVSRIARGKVLLRMERTDFTNVVRYTVEDYRATIESANIQLETTLLEGPAWILGDVTRVAQIVGNLLNNALKFTNNGGSISVSQRVDGKMAVLEIVDSGVGIASELLPELFSPFVQADNSIDRSRGGLGLGLALVRGLVELHGGSVSAQSDGLGRGSRFVVELPMIRAATEPQSGDCRSLSRSRHCRILVVEDNPDAAETTKMLLELAGHSVSVVNSGTEALEAALRLTPQVVLCDIGLPGGMDGYEVARTLRRNERLASCLLIAATGYGQEEDQRRARQAGFDIHLTKPLDPDLLEQTLENALLNRAKR